MELERKLEKFKIGQRLKNQAEGHERIVTEDINIVLKKRDRRVLYTPIKLD